MEAVPLCPQLDSNITEKARQERDVQILHSWLLLLDMAGSGRREKARRWVSWLHASASFRALHIWLSPACPASSFMPNVQVSFPFSGFLSEACCDHPGCTCRSWPTSGCPAPAFRLVGRSLLEKVGNKFLLINKTFCLQSFLFQISSCRLRFLH